MCITKANNSLAVLYCSTRSTCLVVDTSTPSTHRDSSTCYEIHQAPKGRIAMKNNKTTRSGDSTHLAGLLKYVVSNSFKGDDDDERLVVEILIERQRQVRAFVRCIVDEHNALKEMGIASTTSLNRISSVCSKTDVMMAQQRAAC